MCWHRYVLHECNWAFGHIFIFAQKPVIGNLLLCFISADLFSGTAHKMLWNHFQRCNFNTMKSVSRTLTEARDGTCWRWKNTVQDNAKLTVHIVCNIGRKTENIELGAGVCMCPLKGTDCLQKSFDVVFFSSNFRIMPIKVVYISTGMKMRQWGTCNL